MLKLQACIVAATFFKKVDNMMIRHNIVSSCRYSKRSCNFCARNSTTYKNNVDKTRSAFSKYLNLGKDGTDNSNKPQLLSLTINSTITAWKTAGFYVNDENIVDCGNLQIIIKDINHSNSGKNNATNPNPVDSLEWRGIDDNKKLISLFNYNVKKRYEEKIVATSPPKIQHPNFVNRIDHLVIRTNNNDLVKQELENFGLLLAARKSSYPGTEQLFFYCNDGGLLLEVFGPEINVGDDSSYKRYIWGIAFESSNIIKTCDYFNEDAETKIRKAVQPDRSIFTTNKIPKDVSKDFQIAFLTGSKRQENQKCLDNRSRL